MEKEGLVKRIVDENDLRKTHVYLTEKGRKTTETLNEGISGVNDVFVKGMNGAESEAFVKALEDIKASLK